MWNLSFISEQDFTEHVKATIEIRREIGVF